MTTLHQAMKLVDPASRLPDGRPVGLRLQTIQACEAAIALLEIQAAKIEKQIADGPPQSVRGNAEATADWRFRAEMAAGHKYTTITNVRMAMALARETRRRQLVGMRLDRQEHARKLVRIDRSRQDTENDLRRFAEVAKTLLSPKAYEDIWDRVRSVKSSEAST